MSILSSLYALSDKLGVTTRANNITEQLNALNDAIGADHGNNTEEAILNYSRSMAQVTPLTDTPTIAPIIGSTVVFGHTVSNLQSDITITGNKITGKLYETKTGQLPDRWGAGYFLCIQFSDFPTGTTACLAGMKPSYGSGYGDVYADPDHNGVWKMSYRKGQKFKAITTVGNQAITQTFDISELEFVPAD